MDEVNEEQPRFFDSEMPIHSPLRGKSGVLAVWLTLSFGSLGLVYVYAWRMIFVTFVIYLGVLVLDLGVLWYVIGVRVFCAVYAWQLIKEESLHGTPDFESRRLLYKAADMEQTDCSKAMEIYGFIVREFPGSRAGKEAERNIEVLRRGLG